MVASSKRFGVIGCGDVAEFGHLPAIAATPGLELVALMDPNPERLRHLGDQYGVAGRFTTTAGMFGAAKLDAVAVCSPAPVHHANVLDAAAHGVHVLCEKPLGMTDDEVETMISAMERADCRLMTGFVYRFSPVAQRIKALVKDGRIGDVRSLRLLYLWNLHGQWIQDDTGNWIESPRWRGRMLEGGPLVDCGVHQIDLARWWLDDEVAAFRGHGAWVTNYESPDHVYVHLDHEGGAHTMVEVSFTYGHTAREARSDFVYELIGTGGVIRYVRDGWHFEVRDGQGTEVFAGASEKNFLGMYRAFSNALDTGDWRGLPSGRDGLRATQIAHEATNQAMAARLTGMASKSSVK